MTPSVLLSWGHCSGGLRSFQQGAVKQAQIMMRGRVVAQAITVIAMGAGAYFGIKPHDRPKTMEEKLERQDR